MSASPDNKTAVASALGNDASPPEIPDHELIRRVGSGSYGEVWLAKNVLGAYRAISFDSDISDGQ
jgi:hypothetical protein